MGTQPYTLSDLEDLMPDYGRDLLNHAIGGAGACMLADHDILQLLTLSWAPKQSGGRSFWENATEGGSAYTTGSPVRSHWSPAHRSQVRAQHLRQQPSGALSCPEDKLR